MTRPHPALPPSDPMPKDPRQIRRMFTSIAPRYDLLNRILSLSLDRGWRRRTVAALAPCRGRRALDLACGTGDMALDLLRAGARVVASDFAHAMLMAADRRGLPAPRVEADALALPFRSGSFDIVTIAFGLRNLADPAAGLREMHRVLRPDGRLAVLEFSRPPGRWFRRAYYLYLGQWVPRIGDLISGRDGPYRYLADSVRTFPDQRGLADLIEASGFHRTRWVNLTGGIVALHLSTRP